VISVVSGVLSFLLIRSQDFVPQEQEQGRVAAAAH
jgi:hypothetical protein